VGLLSSRFSTSSALHPLATALPSFAYSQLIHVHVECGHKVDVFVLCVAWPITVVNQVGDSSVALSPDGSSAGSFDQLHVSQLSTTGKHASDNTAAMNEMSRAVDGHWTSCDKQSSYYDPHIALTQLFTPVATSGALPYFAAMPSALYHFDAAQRHSESGNVRSESAVAYTLPIPSDAVLVRPRMPIAAGKRTGSHDTSALPISGQSPVMLLSSAVHTAGGGGGAGAEPSATSAATMYGGGFHAPPAQSSFVSHTPEELTATVPLSCCPHCGMGFAAAAVPQNVVYHPTGPSYVIHSFTPTLVQPCYSVTMSSTVAQPPVPPSPAGYTAGPVQQQQQSSVRPPDGIGVYHHQQPRPPLPPSHASASFVSSVPSLNAVRVRTARPPPSCANCGCIGHTQLDCKEPTIDTVLNTRK